MQNSFWPSPAQSLLLQAALLQGSPARDAWAAYRAAHAQDVLDGGTLRLVPLLQANLASMEVNDPLLAALMRTQHLGWYRNQQLMLRARNVLGLLAAEGIETLLLKGLPLALAYYAQPDLRPIGDIDIMLRHHDWQRAVVILTAAGWADAAAVGDPLLRVTNAITFRDRAGFELDLHISPFHECISPAMVEPFWQQAVPLEGDLPSKILCPADQLLHCLAHGLRVNEVAPVRWVADAVIIIRKQPQLDWQRLTDQAKRLRLGRVVAAGLAWLDSASPGLVPASARSALENYPAGLLERFEWHARHRDALSPLAEDIGTFFRLHEDKSLPAQMAQVPAFLQNFFGTTSRRATAGLALRKSFKLLRKMLRLQVKA